MLAVRSDPGGQPGNAGNAGRARKRGGAKGQGGFTGDLSRRAGWAKSVPSVSTICGVMSRTDRGSILKGAKKSHPGPCNKQSIKSYIDR